jgi:predicted naringenin-chalcone synthase
MRLSPRVASVLDSQVAGLTDQLLAPHGLRVGDIDHWAIHPGGPRILTAAASALGLADDALQFSRQILARHGNMSSTTVLFILRAIASDQARGRCAALGFGPGLMMEGALLER